MRHAWGTEIKFVMDTRYPSRYRKEQVCNKCGLTKAATFEHYKFKWTLWRNYGTETLYPSRRTPECTPAERP